MIYMNAVLASDIGGHMPTILIRVSDPMKAQLDRLRTQGYTLNGYIQNAIKKALATEPKRKHPRKAV